jgi:hypothetical protein
VARLVQPWPVAARLVQAVGRARQAPRFRRRRGRGNRGDIRDTNHVRNRTDADARGGPGMDSTFPPATAPEPRRLAGSAHAGTGPAATGLPRGDAGRSGTLFQLHWRDTGGRALRRDVRGCVLSAEGTEDKLRSLRLLWTVSACRAPAFHHIGVCAARPSRLKPGPKSSRHCRAQCGSLFSPNT